MLHFIYLFISLFYFIYANAAYALQSNWSGIEEAKVRIISPLSKAGNNSNIYIGI